MIKGYVDIIGAGLIEGWAYETTAPDAHLRIDILCDGRLLGTGVANGFRSDLATSKIGAGDHSFRFPFDQALDEDVLSRFLVLARLNDAPAVEIPRWTPKQGVAPAPRRLTVQGQAVDPGPRPVFIFGAARSGTSAVAQGLLRSTPYRGNQEGHLLELIGGLDRAVEQHYADKADELVNPRRNTMIKMVAPQYFTDGIASLFTAATRQLFPEGLWLDKTPGPDLTRLAPRLAQIWPNARFIFMRRRAMENLASRRRKYPDNTLREGCRLWASAMDAWAEVRPALAGRALELDQLCVAQTPAAAAAEIGALLGLDAGVVERLGAKFAEHRPEQTSDDLTAALDATDLDWTPEQWDSFDEICGGWMKHYNYSHDAGYFLSEQPRNRFERV